MAIKKIEKTVFTSATGVGLADEINDWLAVNASEFFDKIERTYDSGWRVHCFIGNVIAVNIYADGGSSNGSSVYIKNGNYKVATTTGWLYGIKTSKGIALRSAEGCCYAICKTNEDTVSVALRESATYACADFDKSSDFVTFNAPSIVDSTWIQSGKTVLTPIVNANALTYADGLYLQVFSQYPNVDGIFTINGKQYYTDGVLALEE